MSATCRSCGAPVTWVETAAGKRMPLDVERSPQGNVLVIEGRAVIHRKPVEGGRLPHHASCPDGRAWRRPK